MRNHPQRQAGQAATEFLIAAVFLLVPLFLIIPLLGKYIDIKHAAIGLARYSAWEQTVWPLYHSSIFFGDFHDSGYGVPIDDPKNPPKAVPLNPLWRDHRGAPIFTPADPSLENGKTPIPKMGIVGEIGEGFLVFVQDVFDTFGADFFNYKKSYYTSNIAVGTRSLDQILPRSDGSGKTQENEACRENDGTDAKNDKCLVIRASAAVLVDNWNARSPQHADTRSRGLVPTSLLSPLSTLVNGLIKPVNKVLSHIPGFQIKLPAAPIFGYTVDDLIPYEHYYESNMKLHEKQGLSSYEE